LEHTAVFVFDKVRKAYVHTRGSSHQGSLSRVGFCATLSWLDFAQLGVFGWAQQHAACTAAYQQYAYVV
jgi:hypothetical protein